MHPDAAPDGGLADGRLNAALANELGKLIADFAGRGATRSRAFVAEDVVVCLLEDGATKGEQNIAAAGLTGRNVVAFLSQAHVEPDITMEIFFMDGPLKGFGAIEVIEPE